MKKIDLPNKIVESKIIELEDKAAAGGAFINSITEDAFQGPVYDHSGKAIASTPTELADQILEIAKEIKQYAIQYETLTDLEDALKGGE